MTISSIHCPVSITPYPAGRLVGNSRRRVRVRNRLGDDGGVEEHRVRAIHRLVRRPSAVRPEPLGANSRRVRALGDSGHVHEQLVDDAAVPRRRLDPRAGVVPSRHPSRRNHPAAQVQPVPRGVRHLDVLHLGGEPAPEEPERGHVVVAGAHRGRVRLVASAAAEDDDVLDDAARGIVAISAVLEISVVLSPPEQAGNGREHPARDARHGVGVVRLVRRDVPGLGGFVEPRGKLGVLGSIDDCLHVDVRRPDVPSNPRGAHHDDAAPRAAHVASFSSFSFRMVRVGVDGAEHDGLLRGSRRVQLGAAHDHDGGLGHAHAARVRQTPQPGVLVSAVGPELDRGARGDGEVGAGFDHHGAHDLDLSVPGLRVILVVDASHVVRGLRRRRGRGPVIVLEVVPVGAVGRRVAFFLGVLVRARELGRGEREDEQERREGCAEDGREERAAPPATEAGDARRARHPPGHRDGCTRFRRRPAARVLTGRR